MQRVRALFKALLTAFPLAVVVVSFCVFFEMRDLYFQDITEREVEAIEWVGRNSEFYSTKPVIDSSMDKDTTAIP